jgi:hypothetical protein
VSNTVRPEDFGKDLGLIHEVVVTGRKVGAGCRFWARLAHDEDLFRRVFALVQGGKTKVDKAWISFTTTGRSIREQQEQHPEIWCGLNANDPVLDQKGSVGRRLSVRIGAVPNSFGKRWITQKALLEEGTFVPEPWDLVNAAIAYKEATGGWPDLGYWLRTDAISSRGRRVDVGLFSNGVGVSDWDDACSSNIGLAVASIF